MSTLRRTPSGAVLLCALASLLTVSACADGTDQPTSPAVAPQMAKGGSTSGTVTVIVTLAGKGNLPGYPVTVGLVGPAPAGPRAWAETNSDGVATFADVPNGQYCVWASPVSLDAFSANGTYIVPPGSFVPTGNGLPNQGAVLTSGNKQDLVTDATYTANCRGSTRPVSVSGNTQVKLQLAAYGTSTATLYGFDGLAVATNTTAYLVTPFSQSWRPDPGIETLQPGFLLGATQGAAGLRELPAPDFSYYVEVLTFVPTTNPDYDIPAAKGLFDDGGPRAFGTVYLEPLSCRVDSLFDATGDAGNPDIQGQVYYGYGADADDIHPVVDRFGVWWEQQQTGTVSMEYDSRTIVDGFPTLQLTATFTVAKSGSSCSIGSLSVTGSATSAGMTAYVYCLVSAITGLVRVTVVETGMPEGFTSHTFAIGAQGNSPGPAESVPSASKNGGTASYVDGGIKPDVGECEFTANDPKFDVLN